MPDPVFEFEEFELHCGRLQLLRKGHLRVEPKPLELLILLVPRKGLLVSRREIVEKLWESDVFVDTDHSINTAIRKLRYLLRDDSEPPKYFETVTGMGYRFVAPVLDKPEADHETIENKPEARAEANQQPPVPLREVEASSVEPLNGGEPGRWSTSSLAIKSHLGLGITTAILLLALEAGAWW